MKSTRSTGWCRLGLALLAVAGFVAPLAQREADGVVQTAGGTTAAVVSPAAIAQTPTLSRGERESRASPPHEREAPDGPRWLRHRALLL